METHTANSPLKTKGIQALHTASTGTKGVDFVAVNTDKQVLNASSATYKIQIGTKAHASGIDRKGADVSR